MINITNFSRNIFDFLEKKKNLIISVLIILLTIGYFNLALAVGLSLIIFLSALTFLILHLIGLRDEKLKKLFLIAFLIHLLAVLFIHYTNFQPFGGGADYESYHNTAVQVSQRFEAGNFSLEGLRFSHYFALIIGIIYVFTLPEMIVGQLLTVWLAAMSVLFIYLIVFEISGSKKWAFLVGLVAIIYPSYIYFGSVLLKDTLVIPLALLGILITIKILKNFDWKYFLLFFLITTAIIHFRFYIGYALVGSFIISWFIASTFSIKKRVIYGLIMVFLLGFSPYFLSYGYYGIKPLQYYLKPDVIKVYREVVYAPPAPPSSPTKEPEAVIVVATPNPSSITNPTPTQNESPDQCQSATPSQSLTLKDKTSSSVVSTKQVEATTPTKSSSPTSSSASTTPTKSSSPTSIIFSQSFVTNNKDLIEPVQCLDQLAVDKPYAPITPAEQKQIVKESGKGSTFVVKTGLEKPSSFLVNSSVSFIQSLLGPFPWQIKYKRHLFSLAETIPWYFLFIFVSLGVYQMIKRRYRFALPLLIFSIMALGALSLFINNYGIIVRIRIPSFLALLCLVPFAFTLQNRYIKNIENKLNQLWQYI